jgi:hypothetical protein
LEVLIDTLDKSPAELRALADAFGAVGQVTLPTNCTAIHIGNQLVLTAAHCFFPDHDFCTNINYKLRVGKLRSGARFQVEWKRIRDVIPKWTSIGTGLVHMEFTRDRDFAIIRVDGAPPNAIDVTCDQAPLTGDLAILHHPKDAFLHFSSGCTTKTWDNAALKEEDQRGPAFFQYDCSTARGSSGAPIFLIPKEGSAGDRKYDLIGVHSEGGICTKERTADFDKTLNAMMCFPEVSVPGDKPPQAMNGGFIVRDRVVCDAIKQARDTGIPDGAATFDLPYHCTIDN